MQTGTGTLGSLVCFVRSQLTCIQSHTDGGVAGTGDENIQDRAFGVCSESETTNTQTKRTQSLRILHAAAFGSLSRPGVLPLPLWINHVRILMLRFGCSKQLSARGKKGMSLEAITRSSLNLH